MKELPRELSQMSDVMDAVLSAAATVSLRHFRKPVPIEVKADESPVTRADREAEAAMRREISARFPHHGVYGEEEGEKAGTGGTWILDPIDGTKSFVSGNPLFGCLAGFQRAGVMLIGGITVPALNEHWRAIRGHGARFNGDECRTSNCASLGDARLMTTSPAMFDADEAEIFERVAHGARYVRFGGDCYCYGLLAIGWVDVVMEAGLQPYDYLPLIPIIEEAGGVITDWSGRPPGSDASGKILATASLELHRNVLDIIGG
jgi:histidinol phosphatase-like enzyme (inositol monophosphatase family)